MINVSLHIFSIYSRALITGKPLFRFRYMHNIRDILKVVIGLNVTRASPELLK